MQDRELLELAAKAVGFKAQYSENFGDFTIGDPGGLYEQRWNPIENDGDAFRLFAKLGIEIDMHRISGYVAACPFDESWIFEPANQDIDSCCALRRAIVRCAAEIGKSIP